MAEWNEKEQSRLQKICNIGHILLVISIILISALIVIGAIMIGYLSIDGGEGIKIGDIVIGLVCSVLLVITLIILDKIVKGISIGESPFTYQNADRLRLIAIISLITFILSVILRAIFVTTMDEGSMTDVSLDSLITAAVIYVVSLIFRYGAQLQIQSDETV